MTFVFKTSIIYCLYVLLICGTVAAQKVLITGTIVTDSGKVLQDCYVKIAVKRNHQVLSFFATAKENSFSVEVPFTNPDSFYISASHTGYRYTTVARYVSRAETLLVHLVMPLAPDTLNNITIHSLPIWAKGDTTFFNANSFKEGDEHKLKDLVSKMPGFAVDKTGNLLYKKQIVDKIMIDGEQIFADKIKLMLDNFPVYVINNVQVIKNQTDDPLLKGLVSDDKLFVNLSLNKNVKLKTAFGDGEAGIGTQTKYSLNPVLFSLYGKIKIGYIGNWNNVGNGIGWKEQDELKSAPIRTAEQWMMQSNQLITINNLENRRYITNSQSDNRFQINIPFTKKIKSTTEIDVFKDRQKQIAYSSSSLYNGAGFTQQTNITAVRNRPYSLLLKENVFWDISTSKRISTQVSLYHNGNTSSSNSMYNEQGTMSNVQNNITNNWNSYLVSLSYTHRNSTKKAVRWFADLSEHNYPQKVVNISDSWPSIFQLPDSGYDVLNQHIGNKEKMATLGWTSITKTKRGMLETGILLNALSASIATNLSLTNLKDSLAAYPEGYSNKGSYYTSSVVGYARKTIRLFNVPFSVKGEYGFGASGKTEDSVSHYNHLLYSLNINNQSNFGKFLLGKFEASFSQRQLEAYKLYGILLPINTNSFHNNLNVGIPSKIFNTSYNLSVSWNPQFVVGLYAMYSTNFSGLSSINHLTQFIQFSADSGTKRLLNNYFVSFNTNIFSLKQDFHLSADIGYNGTQRFIKYQSGLIKNSMTIFYINTIVTKSWGKIYYLNMSAAYTNVGFNLPGALQTQIAQNVSDIKASLSQRVAINKLSNIVLDADYFDKNMFTPHNLSFVIADVEYNFMITKSPLSFAIRLQNITNQTKYTYIDNSPLIQSYFSIPLVKRNIFLTVRYEL